MANVIRWGRSAYETDETLAAERAAAEAAGLSWRGHPDREPPSDLADADVLVVTSKVRVDADVLERFGGDLVVTTTSGHDHVDLDAARARSIQVARCPLARRDAVVDHALAELVVLLRRHPALLAAAGEGRWARGDLPELAPVALCDATVLVVGLGVIGTVMAHVLDARGARVLGVDPAGVPSPAIEVSLEEGLALADAVTLHCALTPSSRALLDADALARLRPDAVVVNTARGDVLDVDAAVDAVRSGRLGGISVDVFPTEPWPRLADASDPAVRFTPHAAGYSRGLGGRVASEVGAALRAWAAGEPVPHRVA